jgi:hypothetical protein
MKSILNEREVRAIFSSFQKECDVLIALFEKAVPDWDEVEYVLEGRPHMGEKGWRAVYDLFCKFNEDHPGENSFAGGLWLSTGFLKDECLGDWEVDSSQMKFAFKNNTRH